MTYVHSQDRRGATLRQEKTVAYHSAEFIARALGGTSTGGQWLARCPNHDDKRPSLSIRDGNIGQPIFSCKAGCRNTDIQDALRGMGLWPEFRPGERRDPPPRPRPVPTGPSVEELRNRARAVRIWNDATEFVSWSPVEFYLRRRCIWSAAKDSNLRFATLRHPQSREEDVPCLIVPRMNPQGAVVAIQRIFLTPDGKRYRKLIVDADGCERASDCKLSLGTDASAWAMLQPDTDRLLLAEGPETGLSASLIFARPCWAKCGPFPSSIELPETVRDVLIAHDNDPNGGSERKAKVLAEFIRGTGRTCELKAPPIGSDFNDTLLSVMTEEQKAAELAAIANVQSLIERSIAVGCVLGEGRGS